ANGNPTRHYRLDLKKFWQALASALKVSRKKLTLLLQKPSSAKTQIEIENGQKTITTLTPLQSPTDVVVNTAIQEAKKVRGISDHTARQLVARYGTEHVLNIAPRFQVGNWKNPAGAFVQALREN